MEQDAHAEARSKLQDRASFEALTEPHRRELRVHCYRMLGSFTEAEDMVQETLLKAWKSRRTYAGRSTVRAWLYRIATNTCLDELADRKRRALPTELSEPADPSATPREPVLDPIWLQPYPDRLLPDARPGPAGQYELRESVRLAFLVALQSLPPRQRAILLLRDVLEWPAADVASMLEVSESSVTSALYRARVKLEEHDLGEQPKSPDDRSERQLLERYVRAWESADLQGLIALLKEEATFPMPPLPDWYRGRRAIGTFLANTALRGEAHGRWRLKPTRANGQPAFGLYRRDAPDGEHAAFALQVLTIEEGLVADVTTFGFPDLFPAFDLAPSLEGGD